MKTINTTIKTLLAISVFAIVFLFTACSEDNYIMNGTSNTAHFQTDNPESTVTVTPKWIGGVLSFDIHNGLPGIVINDFHVQFDSTVKITGWVTPMGWQIDPTSTDTAHGKIGDKLQNGQPILPGQNMNGVIAVQLRFTGVSKKRMNPWWDFTWQATRDGIVVFERHGQFPPR